MISIGIVTFELRFEKYFIPLINQIRSIDSETEILIAVNGEHKQEFGEDYRQKMLEFCARNRKVYPIFFLQFRAIAKLWNTIIVHANNDHILILNDDVSIVNPNFIKEIEALCTENQCMFLLNDSWSHFVVYRKEVDELGYFDERLLGTGEEDGDMTWRYIEKYGRTVPRFNINGLENFFGDTLYTHRPINIRCHSGTKYSAFNRDFIINEKYRRTTVGIKGMFDTPMEIISACPQQYPNEKFYRERRGEL